MTLNHTLLMLRRVNVTGQEAETYRDHIQVTSAPLAAGVPVTLCKRPCKSCGLDPELLVHTYCVLKPHGVADSQTPREQSRRRKGQPQGCIR